MVAGVGKNVGQLALLQAGSVGIQILDKWLRCPFNQADLVPRFSQNPSVLPNYRACLAFVILFPKLSRPGAGLPLPRSSSPHNPDIFSLSFGICTLFLSSSPPSLPPSLGPVVNQSILGAAPNILEFCLKCPFHQWREPIRK